MAHRASTYAACRLEGVARDFELCGCAEGTIKSRANRAQACLIELLGFSVDELGPDKVIRSAMRGSPDLAPSGTRGA